MTAEGKWHIATVPVKLIKAADTMRNITQMHILQQFIRDDISLKKADQVRTLADVLNVWKQSCPAVLSLRVE